MNVLVAVRTVFDGRRQDLPYLLQGFVGLGWSYKLALTID